MSFPNDPFLPLFWMLIQTREEQANDIPQ